MKRKFVCLAVCCVLVFAISGQGYGAAGDMSWNLASDFHIAPNQANPNPDSMGNLGVWYFMQSDSLVHDPAMYSLLPEFITDSFYVPGLQAWQGSTVSTSIKDKLPSVRINATGYFQWPRSISWPANMVNVHPLPDRLVIAGWRSPVRGSIGITGGVTDIDPNCGDGIAWTIDKNSVNLTGGSILNGGVQNFSQGMNGSVLSDIAVNQGDFIYFVVDPNGGHSCDSTGLDATITLLSQACVQPPSGMIGWWPGDGNGNDVVGGHNAALINGATFAEGKVGQAISFDGVDGRVEVPSNADLNITGPLTIDAWFNLSAPISSMSSPIVAKWGDTLFGGAAYGLFVMGPGWGIPGTNNKVAFMVSSSGGDLTFAVAPDSIPLSEWHHLAGVYNGASLKLYVDGVLVAERAYSAGIHVNSVPLVMGSYNPRYTSFMGPLRGYLDEVELFNRALTTEEITSIYAAGSAGKCKSANRPPVAEAGPDQTVELTSCTGASVTLDGSGSSDPDGNSLTYAWTWPGGNASGAAPTVTLPYGATTVTLTVDDGKGGTTTDEVVINVVDTTPPALNATLSPNVLWPPNHKYVTVTPSVTVQDACVGTTDVELLSASSSEPDNGLGDGDTANDIVVNSDGTLSLRAERSGTGSGRTYMIHYQATDMAGNSATAAATVTVPHESGKK